MNRIIQNYKRELNNTYNELKDYVVIKDTGQGCIQAFIDCLEYDLDSDLLYFEDDAILCKNFEARLNDVFNNLGQDKLIQLFSLKRVYDKTTLMNGSTYCGNVCFYIPSKLRKEMAEYWHTTWSKSKCYEENPNAMDFLVRDFLKDNKYKYWLVVPNLVQHQDGKSVIDPRRSSKRKSLYFIDDNN